MWIPFFNNECFCAAYEKEIYFPKKYTKLTGLVKKSFMYEKFACVGSLNYSNEAERASRPKAERRA